MEKYTILILITCLAIIFTAGCSKKGKLGDSNRLEQNNPKVVEPNTEYTFTKGLNRQKLSMNLNKATSFYKETYPNISEFLLANLYISDNRYVWEFIGTDGFQLYKLEFDAETEDILWEGILEQTEEQQKSLEQRMFTPKDAIAYTKAISTAESVAKGSVNTVRLEKSGDNLVYMISFESETSRDTIYINAKTGELIE